MYHAIPPPNRNPDHHRDVLALLVGYNHLFILFLVRLTEGLFLCPACLALRRTHVTPNVFEKVNLCLVLSRKAPGKPLGCHFLCKVRPLLAPPVIYPYGIENAVDGFIRNFRLRVLSDLGMAYFRILSYEQDHVTFESIGILVWPTGTCREPSDQAL